MGPGAADRPHEVKRITGSFCGIHLFSRLPLVDPGTRVFAGRDTPSVVTGVTLAALIRKRWPPIDLILTSDKSAPRPEEMPERGAFFSRPYIQEDVVATLRRMAGA